MYTKKNIGLTNCQIKKLASAVDNGTPVSFTKYSVTGNVPVYLTKGQLEGLTAGKPLKFSKKQLMHMKTQGGFLGALFKLIGPAMKLIAPVAKTLGPAVATGALSGAASYGANKLLRKAAGDDKSRGKGLELKPYGKGLELKPYKGGNVTVELTPDEINGLISTTRSKKTGGFLPLLASLAASLLPTLLGNGLSKSDVNTAKDVILSVASQKGEKKAQQRLDQMTQKYGSGLLGKLFGLPGNKVPVLGDIPLLNVLF